LSAVSGSARRGRCPSARGEIVDSLAPSNAAEVLVTLGIDTHADTHVAVALDQLGRRLGSKRVPTTEAGYAEIVAWAEGFGVLDRVGVEGSGSFGAGLARHLRSAGAEVVEVNRPNRQYRRRFGKHDTADAESAARAVQAGTAVGQPKSADGTVEMLRALRVARRSAVKARTQAANQLRALVLTAPEGLRAELRGLSTAKLVSAAARLRPGRRPDDPTAATKMAMRSIARRHRWLWEEIAELDEQLERLVAEAAPALVALRGVGTETAASLVVAAGDNPERLRSEAAFASMCGVSPVPASSGRVRRHRLNRGGNREANRALYLLALGRMSWDGRTREYVARRTAEGKSKREILRCLKRYIAREIYRILTSPPGELPAPAPAP
jgi:transposase